MIWNYSVLPKPLLSTELLPVVTSVCDHSIRNANQEDEASTVMQQRGGRPESVCRDAAVGLKDKEEEEGEEERTAADALASELQPSPQEGEPTRHFPQQVCLPCP